MRYQILYLNQDPLECAKEYTDEHLKIMCLRLAQTLSYTYRKNAKHGDLLNKLYYVYVLNTDSDSFWRWIMESNYNYLWTFNHLKALLAEYQYRFDKPHLSAPIAEVLKGWTPPYLNSGKEPPFSPPPFEENRAIYGRDNNKKQTQLGGALSTINSYRAWYDGEQLCQPHNFTKRSVPAWSTFHVGETVVATPRRQTGSNNRMTRPPRPTPTLEQRARELLLAGLTDGR